MEFKVLSKDDCEMVRLWRNETMKALRTPYQLTQEQQEDFYYNTICDRRANARYWGIWSETKQPSVLKKAGELPTVRMKDTLIGMTGIENIEWENSRGEISLILDPKQRSMGHGNEAVSILLSKGFGELNLDNIWGVCYECNPAVRFWERQINKYGAEHATFPNMKFWDGKYWRGLYFNFERGKYEHHNT